MSLSKFDVIQHLGQIALIDVSVVTGVIVTHVTDQFLAAILISLIAGNSIHGIAVAAQGISTQKTGG